VIDPIPLESSVRDGNGSNANIVQQPHTGTTIGLLNHKINNKNGVLSIKATDYGKDHENRDSAV